MNSDDKKTILLVEDEAITAILEKQQLEKKGYSVHHVTTGEDAVKVILDDALPVHLVLMDIDLGPGIDGTQAAEQILKHKDIPVVFLSSHTESEVVEMTEMITSYGYVVKNSGIVVLDASIKMAYKLFETNKKLSNELTERKRAEEQIQEMDVRMRKLFANVPDLIYQFTRRPDGSYYVPIASKGISNIFGCSPEDVRDIFEPISRVIYHEDAARVIEDIEYSAKHLTYFTCEFRVHIPGRDIQWILSRSTPERLPDGSVTWYGFNLDITKHKQAKEERRKFELRWDSLVQSIPDFIAIHDLEGKFIYMNRYAEGFSENDIIGKSIYSFMTPESAELFRSMSKLCVQTKQIQYFEHKAEGDLKKISNYDNYIIPLIDDDICINLLIVSRDITERKHAEEEIKIQLSQKETLLREVHHRIKNNISNIENLLLLQIDSTDNPEAKSVIKDAISRVQSMRILYDKLLVSKDLHEISIKNYIEDLVDSLHNVFVGEDNIIIEKHISDFSIKSKEAINIGIIINELLTNVFKYAFKDRAKNTVSVSIEKTENMVTIIIQDNGIGIDERILENKSPGLGLSIVKMLVEQLKGAYSIVNENGTKSVIQFKI